MTAPRRTAFTLVELLVVTTLFLTFFGLVASSLRTTPDTQVRRLAQLLFSALMETQTRAVGIDLGAALLLEPSANVPNLAGNIVRATPRPKIYGSAGLSTSATTAVLQTPSLANADGPNALLDGYRIRFSSTTGAFEVTPWLRLVSGTIAAFRANAGQNLNNTIWPADGGTYWFSVPRYPSRGDLIATAPTAAGIDFRFSGVGNDPYDPLSTFGSFGSSGTLGVVYDSLGHVDSVMRDVYAETGLRDEIPPTMPIYFLVARVDAIQEQRALASQSAIWVVVTPATGRVITAPNVPQTVDESLLTATDANQRQTLRGALWAARGRARAGATSR